MSVDEARSRCSDLVSEIFAHESWDSEFTPSPHSPGSVLARVVELGADAVPALCELLLERDEHVRWWAAVGLGECGQRAPAQALAALRAVPPSDYAGTRAREAIGLIDLGAFFALPPTERKAALADLARTTVRQGGTKAFLAAMLERDDEDGLLATLSAMEPVPRGDRETFTLVSRALQSPRAAVRAKAAWVLGRSPDAGDAEELIEAMVTSGTPTTIDRVAWHPSSRALVEVLIAKGNVGWLGDLLQRRRCAGLVTEPTTALLAFLEDKLRHPDRRDFRFKEHDVHDAARAALELGDARLVPALVDAVRPENGGYAWQPLVKALTFFAASLPVLRERQTTAKEKVQERLGWMIDAVTRARPSTLEWPHGAFVSGSIDHTTDCAFSGYAQVLREQPSAAAAFQLAWIDRAFGVTITTDRVAWIRGLGLADAALLEDLSRPVPALSGLRLSWRKCGSAENVKEALAAGLPGLAFTGSRDPAHQALAKTHVDRVERASTHTAPSA